ncbi:TetR/AcrR family transcriptional regulator [Kitasatospora sp. NPDC052896]|uniref:TetR/AcrR family transcriptional regulator n=1 Tax=Kitasatospora sp. NPDC052896 TaxID=3364061 RepID=UPI0037CBF769
MPKGTTKRRPRTRAALLTAALEAFAEHGFQATTIEQVCVRAGYTRGAFYSNFSSKEELFLALFDQHAEQTLSRLAARTDALATEDFSLDRLAELVSEVEPAEREWYLVTTEFTLHAIRDPQAAWILARHDGRLRAELARGLTGYLERAGLTLTVAPEELARLLIAIREGGLAQSYVEPEQLPPGGLDRRFLATILSAVTTRADATDTAVTATADTDPGDRSACPAPPHGDA